MSFIPDPSEVDPQHYTIGGKNLRKIWEEIAKVDYWPDGQIHGFTITWEQFLKKYNIDKCAQWDSKDMKK